MVELTPTEKHSANGETNKKIFQMLFVRTLHSKQFEFNVWLQRKTKANEKQNRWNLFINCVHSKLLTAGYNKIMHWHKGINA